MRNKRSKERHTHHIFPSFPSPGFWVCFFKFYIYFWHYLIFWWDHHTMVSKNCQKTYHQITFDVKRYVVVIFQCFLSNNITFDVWRLTSNVWRLTSNVKRQTSNVSYHFSIKYHSQILKIHEKDKLQLILFNSRLILARWLDSFRNDTNMKIAHTNQCHVNKPFP